MTDHKARKADARVLAQAENISYTSALRQVTSTTGTSGTARPPVL
ncbi:hypothetical protein [Umezawaea sp. Da 62-37]|nr:hypothetical protein [Umezawaea sp. Da 62-37]WNV86665.1 hypothetical protein RM788_52560 [Umezawaea sp. Da 62-37]WNV86752.1 hypothetical protein RM788_00245 [Umezawaea sp. Da 62-37]